MPLHLYHKPSFKRSLKHFDFNKIKTVGSILEALSIYYSSGCNLQEAQKVAPGFFYKQLRKPYYEAGIEKDIRVIIKKEYEKCIAILAGNHDQIRQFLASL